MKRTLFLSFLIFMAGSSYGQQNYNLPGASENRGGNANGYYGSINPVASGCHKTLEEYKEKSDEDKKKFDQKILKNCEALKSIAIKNGENLLSPREGKSTLDKRITCDLKAGYTVDFEACVNTITTYDALAVLEQGMFQSQKMDMNNSQQTITNNTNAQIAKDGDVTSAALQAQKDQTLKAKELNEQQAASYTAATLALVAAINSWPSNSDTGIFKFCSSSKKEEASDCVQKMKTGLVENKKYIFANDFAREAFKGAAIQFAVKGGKALIEAIRLALQAEQIQKVKDAVASTNDDAPQFSPCMSDPTLPDCAPVGPGPRVSGSNFGGGGDFGISDGSSNAFNIGNGTDSTFGDAGAATDIKEKPNASSVSSPFADMAKQANSILDPAAAANMTPGSNSGGAGGGGGGGGMGGGSASLGNDLKGADPDENKEKDIKTSEVSGNYSQGGGAGFKAIKSGADDTFNPYGNLLDAKSQNGGAVVEDRSIASEGKPFTSGLFERLSSRYDQAIKSKKIDPIYPE